MKQQDQLNHILGNYISIGVNNPKKYPKDPALSANEKKVVTYTNDAAYERIARIKYGKKL